MTTVPLASAPAAALEGDRRLLVEAVRKAGGVARRHFRRPVRTWEKKPGHVVSAADLAVDACLRECLVGARPDYGWLSEESGTEAGALEARRFWLVDPIDGTRSFLKGRPEFAVAAALVENGRPLAAAVYNPATDELFDAVPGGGARLNGRRVRAGEHEELRGARLLLSRTEAERATWPRAFPEATVLGLSSFAYKLALVAAGRADGAVTLTPKSAWDVAAGDLLLAVAGGIATTLDGAPFAYDRPAARYPSLVAAAPRLHRLLLNRLRTFRERG